MLVPSSLATAISRGLVTLAQSSTPDGEGSGIGTDAIIDIAVIVCVAGALIWTLKKKQAEENKDSSDD
ncbi:MAG: hypothetical protein NXI04_17105 [Planctomycetaceae bacterium]|nr:hypothetical protein [Planctomycetaceae bacterium]